MAPGNLLSVDAEDYYSLAVRDQLGVAVDVSDEVAPQTLQLLDFLERAGLRATWFIVGSLARVRPDLVRAIASRGHEIASHGYAHQPLSALSADSFRADLVQSIRALEDTAQRRVRAFRAPAFSLRAGHTWAFEIMAAEGIAIDSSLRIVWPGGVRAGRDLIASARRWGISEIPGFAVGVGASGIPVGGGGGLRLLPAALTRAVLRRITRAGLPAALYVHPYDFPSPGRRTPWPRANPAAAFRLWRFDVLQRIGRRRLPARLLDAAAAADVAGPSVVPQARTTP